MLLSAVVRPAVFLPSLLSERSYFVLFVALAVFLGLDQIREMIVRSNSSIRVTGFADSGMFLDYSSRLPPDLSHFTKDDRAVVDGVVDYPACMRRIFQLYNMSAGTNTACLRHSKDPRDCVLAVNLLPHISTPLFILQV